MRGDRVIGPSILQFDRHRPGTLPPDSIPVLGDGAIRAEAANAGAVVWV